MKSKKKKKCRSCRKVKFKDEFYKDARNSDGLQSYCKECVIKRNCDYRRLKSTENQKEAVEIMKKKYFQE